MSAQASLGTILDTSSSWTWATAFGAFVIVSYTLLGLGLGWGLVQLEMSKSRHTLLKTFVVGFIVGVGWIAGRYVDDLFHAHIWKGLVAVAVTVVWVYVLRALTREVGPTD